MVTGSGSFESSSNLRSPSLASLNIFHVRVRCRLMLSRSRTCSYIYRTRTQKYSPSQASQLLDVWQVCGRRGPGEIGDMPNITWHNQQSTIRQFYTKHHHHHHLFSHMETCMCRDSSISHISQILVERVEFFISTYSVYLTSSSSVTKTFVTKFGLIFKKYDAKLIVLTHIMSRYADRQAYTVFTYNTSLKLTS